MIRDRLRMSRRAILGLALAAGLLFSGYLSVVRASGGLPACGLAGACDVVALSEYSTVAGIPVAYLGTAFSAVLLVLVLLALRRSGNRALWSAYGLATLGVVAVAWLTYLELFVIRAICIWCVGFAASVVAAWAALALEVRARG